MTSLLLAVIYLAFIGLGLPDSLLGAAWPAMQPSLGVPLSYAGILSMIIALGTVVSSLQSDRLTLRLGTGRVTTISVGMTAAALLGFSLSGSFWQLCLWAIPYGLGAGSVDAALNNYVALHYKSRHMSWLHCMWGVGATTGPYIMGLALTRGAGWSAGYATIAGLQVLLTLLLLLSLPLWKSRPGARETAPAATPAREQRKPLSLAAVLGIPGAREIMIAFFCYCALEQTCGLWASSFLHLGHGMTEERAAGLAALFFLGVTAGRAASGFLTIRLSDTRMIRLGQLLLLIGTSLLFLPASACALAGLVLAGLGCAPIYPCVIHATPSHFGKELSQAVIGVEMAAAYIGTMLMPPLFGVLANHIAVTLLPLYLLALLALMTAMTERLERKTGRRARS